jgi:putative chitinase
MTDWNVVLPMICPHGNHALLHGFALAMPAVIADADLSTRLRQAHFLAQCCKESDGFKTMVEYASGREYEGRHDLGNTHPGDGIRFKGRGAIQLTGRANYAQAGMILHADLINHPELAALFPLAARVAALYWQTRHINGHADVDDIVAVTRAVNGGENGLADRKMYLAAAKKALGLK